VLLVRYDDNDDNSNNNGSSVNLCQPVCEGSTASDGAVVV
jgi:hypothetical protein